MNLYSDEPGLGSSDEPDSGNSSEPGLGDSDSSLKGDLNEKPVLKHPRLGSVRTLRKCASMKAVWPSLKAEFFPIEFSRWSSYF